MGQAQLKEKQPYRNFDGGPQKSGFPRVRLVSSSSMSETGLVKWYDRDRCFGFVTQSNGDDVFFHRSIVLKYKMSEEGLLKGVPVRFVVSRPSDKKAEITAISFA